MVEMENSSSPMASTTHEKASAEKANIVSAQPPKKKRNLPGMPDPDAEVIALSPKALLATNRFVCEICSKGFQRDQNLQLHRRGHNLPWKLRQRTGNEVVKKRVYVCPEATCVHHDPSRALGDLTGIKKHFCRKHGEKRYTCERCSKKYAVQSDWKAHVKTCGTREYRCDCGTMFSRRDSFITHRAFCDALAQESAKSSQPMSAISNHLDGSLKIPASTNSSSSPPPQPLTPSTGVVSPVLSIQSSELLENQSGNLHQQAGSTSLCATTTTTVTGTGTGTVSNSSSNSGGNVSNSSGVFASIFAPSTSAGVSQSTRPSSPYSDLLCVMGGSERPPADPSLSLSSSLFLSNNASSLYPSTSQDHYRQYSASQQPALSATALLQKAAQMSARSSGSSFLRGLGLAISSSSDAQDNNADTNTATASQWNSIVKLETNSVASSSSLNDHLMMGPSTIFANKPTTLDLLGLGIGANEASSSGFSAFLNSMGGEFGVGGSSLHGVGSGGDTWDDLSDKKPRLL